MTAQSISFYKNLAGVVKTVREAKGFTQSQIADKLGIHRVHYCRFEAGGVAIKADTLVSISRLLHLDLGGVARLASKPTKKTVKKKAKVISIARKATLKKVVGSSKKALA